MKELRFQVGITLDGDAAAALVEAMQQAVEKGTAHLSPGTKNPLGDAEPRPAMTLKERSQHAMLRGQKLPDNMGLLLTTKETAKLLKVSQNTVVSLCKEGTMPKPFRVGRSVRFRYDELRAWVNAGCPTQAEWTFSPDTLE